MERNILAKELTQIELEFRLLIQKDRKNWIRIAKLLNRIEEAHLYKIKARSFTEYVKILAGENSINVSTLWRARSGARIYMELKGEGDLDTLHEKEVKTTPEQLETFSKVRTIAPESLVLSLQERILQGENIRDELKNIWNIYKPLKNGKTERGRRKFSISMSDTQQVHDQHTLALADSYKRIRYHVTTAEYTSAGIINSLRKDDTWIREVFPTEQIKYNSFQDFSLKTGETDVFDYLCVVRNKDVFIYPRFIGIIQLTNKTLGLQLKHRIQRLKGHVHGVYLVFPSSERDKWEDFAMSISSGIGLLEIEAASSGGIEQRLRIRKNILLMEMSTSMMCYMMNICLDRVSI